VIHAAAVAIRIFWLTFACHIEIAARHANAQALCHSCFQNISDDCTMNSAKLIRAKAVTKLEKEHNS